MVEARAPVESASERVCVCCGMATASRGMPACWEHWVLLPEDLRSSIVISQGRGQLSRYTENLLAAVQVWRLTGAWRPKPRKAPMRSGPTADGGIISLFDRRQKSASPPPSRPAAAYG